MKETELRIGNLVFWYADGKNYEAQVTAKDLADDTIYKNFEPIPLTEEILLKCGFEKDNDYKHLYAPIYFAFVRNEWILFLHNCSHRHIKYLHQLQNLYFVLTGEELEINL